MYKVYLKKHEEKRIVGGHPWVFANEVLKIEGKDKNGSLASVYSFDGRFIGRGYINHLSKILVRIFIRNEQEEPDLDFYKERISRANNLRLNLGYRDSYRMVFAEADDLPALIVDKYDDIFSVQFLSLGIEQNREIIIRALIELFAPRGIYERSDVAVREKEGLPLTKRVIYGDFSPRVVFNENGIKMVADLENGQKTGYFLDQKENRFALRRYCQGKTVLDCFCNSGGFSMNAALGGAKSVVAVDISEKALADVNENAKMNGFNQIETVCGDVFELLRKYKADGKCFDVVVLDPPAFTKSAADVPNAYKGYRDINILGMKLVQKGGILVTSSCSHHMTFPLFEKMLKEAAENAGKRVKCLEIKTQSPDHPALINAEETTYLKFFILQVE